MNWKDVKMAPFSMRAFTPSQLPMTPAGRLEVIHEWLAGPEIIDENGEPTGERGAPLITKALAKRLMDAVK